MHASNNLARANALRNAAEPLVNEPRDTLLPSISYPHIVLETTGLYVKGGDHGALCI